MVLDHKLFERNHSCVRVVQRPRVREWTRDFASLSNKKRLPFCHLSTALWLVILSATRKNLVGG